MISGLIDESKFELEEGFLCLDLINTVDWRKSGHPEEELSSYEALVNWALSKRLVDQGTARELLDEAASNPEEAARALEMVQLLREDLYHIFTSIARQDPIPAEDLQTINRFMVNALAHSRLVVDEGRVALKWQDRDTSKLGWMLWPITRSAVALLTSKSVDRIGECADDRGCGWLFYDTTRNRSRRWCSMESCGNRAKAQRHYHGKQAQHARPG